jgi:hypothetical protein
LPEIEAGGPANIMNAEKFISLPVFAARSFPLTARKRHSANWHAT